MYLVVNYRNKLNVLVFYCFILYNSLVIKNSSNRCVGKTYVEESPCSHGAAMPVVFVLPEKIRVGKAVALTAEGTPKSL